MTSFPFQAFSISDLVHRALRELSRQPFNHTPQCLVGVSLHDRRPFYYVASLLDHHTEPQAHEEQQRTHGDGTIHVVVPVALRLRNNDYITFHFFSSSKKNLGRSGP